MGDEIAPRDFEVAVVGVSGSGNQGVGKGVGGSGVGGMRAPTWVPILAVRAIAVVERSRSVGPVAGARDSISKPFMTKKSW